MSTYLVCRVDIEEGLKQPRFARRTPKPFDTIISAIEMQKMATCSLDFLRDEDLLRGRKDSYIAIFQEVDPETTR